MAKRIMIQGTMSNVGKSLLVAGLCRILKQDGYRVSPFKSQNMALNSFVTKEGLEMGRAQVMQAQAAGTLPVVAMNPILLKPVNDTGSQVIVNGEVRGNMSAREYFQYKTRLIPEIRNAYDRLEKEFEIIVIEGAGSPAEINLKENDIVNMGLAEMVDAPVLLAGDIDRGGVFAQLIGTLTLLEPKERARVKGLIINKFRGDKSILEPGSAMLEKRAGIPVVGVVPYMQIELEDEDSLTERFSHKENVMSTKRTSVRENGAALDIAVVRLPRISNFTDFLMLENQETVKLRYVNRNSELGTPDLIILPGTKNTMGDLRWLRESGMEAAICRAKEKGSVLFGICGGFQMLGEWLRDPDGAEEGGEMRGMGFLPMETVFHNKKVRTQVEGRFGEIGGALAPLSGQPVEGYELHMGDSRGLWDTVVANASESESELELGLGTGSASESGLRKTLVYLRDSISGEEKQDGMWHNNVYGTYVHGIFDTEEVVSSLIRALADRKGMPLGKTKTVSLEEYRNHQFDMLADSLREHLDLKRIYEILNGSV